MQDLLPESLVNQLHPLNELPGARLAQLNEKASFEELQPGERLSSPEQCHWFIYVLEGSLMVSAKGRLLLIDGGSKRANTPVFEKSMPQDFAESQSVCRVVRFEKKLFETLVKEEQLSAYDVTDVQINDVENKVFQQIFAASSNGELELPPMPDVAMRVMKMASDPDAGITELIRVIQMDPAVAGSIIQAANSALYRGDSQINDINNAVVRLGLKTTRSLATSIAMRDTYKVKSPLIKERMHTLWEHSVNVSALSYVIANHASGFDPDRALLAGLMHDIGMVSILHYIESHHLEVTDLELENMLDKLRAVAGVLVTNSWGLDSEFTVVVEESETWLRDSSPEPDYCDIVLIAQLLTELDHPRMAKLPSINEIPAYQKLNLGIVDSDKNVALLDDAKNEISEIKNILSA